MKLLGVRIGASKSIFLFTWIWMFATIIVSAYFSFVLFPKIYDEHNSTIVSIKFKRLESKAQTPGGEKKLEARFTPNEAGWREKYLKSAVERDFLFYNACELLPFSQRPICDSYSNWRKVSLDQVGCKGKKLENCKVEFLRLDAEKRYLQVIGLKPVKGKEFSLADRESISFKEPATWGKSASLPLFLICIFLGTKLGRTLGEFVFKPYGNELVDK